MSRSFNDMNVDIYGEAKENKNDDSLEGETKKQKMKLLQKKLKKLTKKDKPVAMKYNMVLSQNYFVVNFVVK